MKSRAGIAQRYGNSAQNLTLSSNAADHTVQTSFTGNAQQQLNGEISLMEKLRDIVAGASKLGPLPAFKTVKFSLLGPITTAIGSIMQGTRGRQENKEAKDNLRAVETKEESR